jgi:hypothetical protein
MPKAGFRAESSACPWPKINNYEVEAYRIRRQPVNPKSLTEWNWWIRTIHAKPAVVSLSQTRGHIHIFLWTRELQGFYEDSLSKRDGHVLKYYWPLLQTGLHVFFSRDSTVLEGPWPPHI